MAMYSKEERDEQVRKMRAVAHAFYGPATRTGAHAFIEFCGFMTKFIDICQNTSDAGVDFNEANTHTGGELTVQDHDIVYLAEKFDCIFGPTLANPEKRAVFFKAMNWEDVDGFEEAYKSAEKHGLMTENLDRLRQFLGLREGKNTADTVARLALERLSDSTPRSKGSRKTHQSQAKRKTPRASDFACDRCGHRHTQKCEEAKASAVHVGCPDAKKPRCNQRVLHCARCNELQADNFIVVDIPTGYELVCAHCFHGVRRDQPTVIVKYDKLPPEGRMRNFASGTSLASFNTLEANTEKFDDDGEIIEPRLRYR